MKLTTNKKFNQPKPMKNPTKQQKAEKIAFEKEKQPEIEDYFSTNSNEEDEDKKFERKNEIIIQNENLKLCQSETIIQDEKPKLNQSETIIQDADAKENFNGEINLKENYNGYKSAKISLCGDQNSKEIVSLGENIKESLRIGENKKESLRMGENKKESFRIGENKKESFIIGENRKESLGLEENKKERDNLEMATNNNNFWKMVGGRENYKSHNKTEEYSIKIYDNNNLTIYQDDIKLTNNTEYIKPEQDKLSKLENTENQVSKGYVMIESQDIYPQAESVSENSK